MARVGFDATDEQKEWLDKQSDKTNESIATVMRQLINEKMKDEKTNGKK